MTCGIYKFENKLNHKVYIGQSSNLTERYKKHLKNVNDITHTEYFYKALRKYGIENFNYEIIEEFEFFDQELLNLLECYYIDCFNSLVPNGYNMVPGGSNGAGLTKGKKVLQYDLKGNFIAEYQSASQASAITNICHSEICACCREECLRTKNFQWKYADSNKIIQDISNLIPKSTEAIWQYDLEGNFIQEFSNFNEASKNIKVSKSSLCKCLKGQTNTCSGYKWSYANQPILKTGKQHRNGKKVGQYDKQGNLIKIYNSALEASKETGVSNANIGSVCKGKRKTAGNYYWKFID